MRNITLYSVYLVAAAVVCKSDLEKLSRVQNVRLLAVVKTMDGLLIRLKIVFGQNIKKILCITKTFNRM